MPGWTAASLIATPNMGSILQGPLTPEQKMKLSGGVTREALTDVVTRKPRATNNRTVEPPATNVIPASTGGVGISPVAPASNLPPFLQGNANLSTNSLPAQDLLSMLTDLIGGQKTDPKLTEAQTVLAQQQAMEVARRNEAARKQESAQRAMSYLQRQMKDAAKFTTGSVGNILTQRYADRAKVLQDQGELNWLNMPSSTFSVPRRSGWTGPAMPGVWGF